MFRLIQLHADHGVPRIGVDPDAYASERAALEEAAVGRPVLFTGPLEHRHLAHLWALADVSVTPSVFPEAFGMVAAEAAACGSPPLVARHSGLAEIAAGLESEYPPEHRRLASRARTWTTSPRRSPRFSRSPPPSAAAWARPRAAPRSGFGAGSA